MNRGRFNWPLLAWLGLTVYVIVADTSLARRGKPMMSTVFRDAVRHPVKRWPIGVVWTYLTAHLFLNLPWDPLRLIGERINATSSMV